MSRRYKILIPILLSLAAIFFYMRWKHEGVEKTFRLFQADSLSIGRIELRKGEQYIILEKQDSLWMMIDPLQWRVQEDLIKNLFRDLINSDISDAVVSESTDNDSYYGLDPAHALQMKLYDRKGGLLDHVFIGNTGNPFDYIRRQGSTSIYQTRTKVANVFIPDAPVWRDISVLNIPESQILRIAVGYRKNSYTLTAELPRWRYTDSRENFVIPVENTAIVRVLNVLNNLNTMQFYDGDNSAYLPLFADPECTVEVFLRHRIMRKLSFARLNDTEFILMLDDDPKVLYGVIFDSINRFTRSAEIFKMLYG